MTSTNLLSKPATSATSRPLRPGERRWFALPIILAGTFMVTLDFFIVNVALPSLHQQLHAGTGAIQFIVAGYGLALASGLITAGRLGDLYGRRRLFALGLALFILTSLVCGLAPTSGVLVLARVAQGIAAALLSPQVLAILGIVYTGDDRARAFTAYGLVLGIAAVSGQLIGGLLIQANVAGLGWRTCFLINVPIGIAALLLTPRYVPATRSQSGKPRGQLDLIGAALVTLGLLAIVFPLIEGRVLGWPLWIWLCLGASAPLLLAFVAYQRWLSTRGRVPLLDLALFGERTFSIGLVTTLAFFGGMASFFLVLALYLQQGRGLSALGAGATFSILGLGYLVASLYAPRLARRLGRLSLTIGALVMALGLVLLQVTSADIGISGPLALLAPGLLLDGLGMGLVLAPLSSLVLAGLPPHYAGAAAGVLATMQQVANALGVAIIGIIFYGTLVHTSQLSAYSQAFGASLIYLIALALAVAALIQLLPRSQRAR